MRTSDVFVREENGRKKRVTRRSRKRSDADAMEIEVGKCVGERGANLADESAPSGFGENA